MIRELSVSEKNSIIRLIDYDLSQLEDVPQFVADKPKLNLQYLTTSAHKKNEMELIKKAAKTFKLQHHAVEAFFKDPEFAVETEIPQTTTVPFENCYYIAPKMQRFITTKKINGEETNLYHMINVRKVMLADGTYLISEDTMDIPQDEYDALYNVISEDYESFLDYEPSTRGLKPAERNLIVSQQTKHQLWKNCIKKGYQLHGQSVKELVTDWPSYQDNFLLRYNFPLADFNEEGMWDWQIYGYKRYDNRPRLNNETERLETSYKKSLTK